MTEVIVFPHQREFPAATLSRVFPHIPDNKPRYTLGQSGCVVAAGTRLDEGESWGITAEAEREVTRSWEFPDLTRAELGKLI